MRVQKRTHHYQTYLFIIATFILFAIITVISCYNNFIKNPLQLASDDKEQVAGTISTQDSTTMYKKTLLSFVTYEEYKDFLSRSNLMMNPLSEYRYLDIARIIAEENSEALLADKEDLIIEESIPSDNGEIVLSEEDPIDEIPTDVLDTVEPVEEAVTETSTDSTSEPISYTIKSGDNFWNIAKKYYGYGGYCNALCTYNGITSSTILHPGDVILIPDVDDPEFADYIVGLSTDVVITNENIAETFADSYSYGVRMEPAVNIDIPDPESLDMKNYTEEVDTSSYAYAGNFKITGYDITCSHCSPNYDTSLGASGVKMIPGYSVATGADLPFGTTIYVEGYGYYVVEDRGCASTTIDIATSSHDACYDLTGRADVYIVG